MRGQHRLFDGGHKSSAIALAQPLEVGYRTCQRSMLLRAVLSVRGRPAPQVARIRYEERLADAPGPVNSKYRRTSKRLLQRLLCQHANEMQYANGVCMLKHGRSQWYALRCAIKAEHICPYWPKCHEFGDIEILLSASAPAYKWHWGAPPVGSMLSCLRTLM